MTGSFILDYYVLVLLASIGVFQVVAAHKGFRGMLLFQRRPASFVFGLVLLVGAFTWFFLSEPRNVSDGAHGLNGNEQFAYFFAGTGTGLAVTLIVSSLRNWSMGAAKAKVPLGLDALKEISYIRAFNRTGLTVGPRIRLWPRIRVWSDATPKELSQYPALESPSFDRFRACTELAQVTNDITTGKDITNGKDTARPELVEGWFEVFSKRPSPEAKSFLGGFVSNFQLGRRIIAWVARGTRRAALFRRRVSSWS